VGHRQRDPAAEPQGGGERHEGELNAGTFLRLTVAWRRAVGGDAAFTITHAAGDSSIARVFGYRGCVASGDPFEDAQAQANTGTTTITTPNLTLATANDMILFVAGAALAADTSNPMSTAGYSGTNPAFTERQDSEAALNANDASLVLADGIRTVASAPGARTATVTTGALATAVNNVGALLALLDAAGGTVATRPPRSRLVRPRILVPSGGRFAR
jgi:hypothetical protein